MPTNESAAPGSVPASGLVLGAATVDHPPRALPGKGRARGPDGTTVKYQIKKYCHHEDSRYDRRYLEPNGFVLLQSASPARGITVA